LKAKKRCKKVKTTLPVQSVKGVVKRSKNRRITLENFKKCPTIQAFLCQRSYTLGEMCQCCYTALKNQKTIYNGSIEMSYIA